jgi:hypothetical protein
VEDPVRVLGSDVDVDLVVTVREGRARVCVAWIIPYLARATRGVAAPEALKKRLSTFCWFRAVPVL